MYPSNYSIYDSEVAQILRSASLGIMPSIDERTDVVPFVPAFSIPKPDPERLEKKKNEKTKGKKKKVKSKKGKNTKK